MPDPSSVSVSLVSRAHEISNFGGEIWSFVRGSPSKLGTKIDSRLAPIDGDLRNKKTKKQKLNIVEKFSIALDTIVEFWPFVVTTI